MDSSERPEAETVLRLTGITKKFGALIANDAISLSLKRGEVVALLGENGAGKTTLMNILFGHYTADEGTIEVFGKALPSGDPHAALAAGIGMVHQHFTLADQMTVLENIVLGTQPLWSFNLGKTRARARIRTLAVDYGLEVDPDRMITELSVGERQRVEIVRCLLQDPRLLIMDEPTSVLTPQEVETLFDTLRLLSKRGVAILYISHKLDEIRVLCDRATILRGGKVVATCLPRDETPRSLAEMMIGATLADPPVRRAIPGRTLLKLTGLSLPTDDPFGVTLSGIDLTLRAGEVTGIAGVAGNGQDELVAVLSGESPVEAGMIRLDNVPIGTLGPNRRRSLGLLSAPEERLGHAAAPEMSLTDNTMLTGRVRQRLSTQGFLKWNVAANFARAVIAQFDVRTPGVDTPARALSGGNLQKFVIGREVMQKPRVLVVNQPTWGVDAAAAAAIRQSLRDLAATGASVLVISQDLDELMEMSDQFAVIAGGRLSATRPAGSISIEEIGRMMGGGEAA